MAYDLTKKDVEVLLLKENYGMSYSAIANELGISKTAARQRYEKAKKREKLFKANMPDNPKEIPFKDYAMKNLDPSTYKALENANIKSYLEFMKLSELEMVMIKGIGPQKFDELVKFKEKLLAYM